MRSLIRKLIFIGLCFSTFFSEVFAQESYRYQWSGFYGGAHFGYGWGIDNIPYSQQIAPPNMIFAGNSGTLSGVLGGSQAGYNLTVTPSFLLGVEADVSVANIANQRLGAGATPSLAFSHEAKINWYGTVRARSGIITSNNTLIYGTGGLAWATIKSIRTQIIGTSLNATPGSIESATFSSLGWAIGAGVERAFSQRWSARLEYLYTDVGTTTVTRVLTQGRVFENDKWSIVRLGLNYKL